MRTYEEHKEFLLGLIEIQLEFAFDKSTELQLPMNETITNYTMIQNLTDFNKNNIFDEVDIEDEDWLLFIKDFNSSFRSPKDMLLHISKHIDKRIEQDLPRFNYAYNNETNRNQSCIILTPKSDNTLELHVDNNYYPESFLEKCFKRDLINMLKELPEHIEYIHMSSWLNQLSAWQKFFPKDYLKNSNVYKTVEEPSLGIFGQFITQEYHVSKGTVKYYMKHRKLRYNLETCNVSVKELKGMYL
jgi:hypothetical protein